MPEESEEGSQVLRERDAAHYLGVSRRWLQERRADGRGPKYCRLASRTIRYRRQSLDDFMEARIHASTAEYS